MGARRADDPMAEALDHLLDVHGDQRLVLDDQDIGRDLARNFVARLAQAGSANSSSLDVENLGRLLLGEAFDRDQQERLARARGERGQIGGGALLPGRLAAASCGTRIGDRGEQLGEKLVERDALVGGLGEDADVGDDRLQHRCDQRIAARLRSGYGTRRTGAETADAEQFLWTSS